jgi:hypothetical protein
MNYKRERKQIYIKKTSVKTEVVLITLKPGFAAQLFPAPCIVIVNVIIFAHSLHHLVSCP